MFKLVLKEMKKTLEEISTKVIPWIKLVFTLNLWEEAKEEYANWETVITLKTFLRTLVIGFIFLIDTILADFLGHNNILKRGWCGLLFLIPIFIAWIEISKFRVERRLNKISKKLSLEDYKHEIDLERDIRNFQRWI